MSLVSLAPPRVRGDGDGVAAGVHNRFRVKPRVMGPVATDQIPSTMQQVY
jgi:hypothetical protein